MPRFVILRHEPSRDSGQPTHWDVMLEDGTTLRTWSIAEPLMPNTVLRAERKADHRLVYLTYEGEVSRGRGFVKQEAQGSYLPLNETEGHWAVSLQSSSIRGTLIFQQVGPDSTDWQLQLVTNEQG